MASLSYGSPLKAPDENYTWLDPAATGLPHLEGTSLLEANPVLGVLDASRSLDRGAAWALLLEEVIRPWAEPTGRVR